MYERRPTDIHNLPALQTFRTILRNHLTPAEATLWKYLKNSQLDGRKFRRQHSVGRYILDFYCPAEKLGVELDGEGHFTARAESYDRERRLFLEYFGIKVVRFENQAVFRSTAWILERIKSDFGWFERTTPASEASATPPW